MDNWINLRDAMNTWPDHGFSHEARTLHIAPISHGSGMILPSTFYAGGCTVTMNVSGLTEWCRIVEEERITHCLMVPTILYRLMEIPAAAERDLSTLKTITYGAAPMSPSKLKGLIEKFGTIFIQGYGSTEHFSPAAALLKSDHVLDIPEDIERLASTGKITIGSEVKLMDDDGNPVADGERGELWLRSRGVCLGYLDNPKKNR